MKSILQNLYTLQTLDLDASARHPSMTAALRTGIPESVLTQYDRARARGKKGVAFVRNHVCTNCRIQVPRAVTVSLIAGMMEVCGNCGVYLCLPEPDEQAAPKAPVLASEPLRRKKKVSA